MAAVPNGHSTLLLKTGMPQSSNETPTAPDAVADGEDEVERIHMSISKKRITGLRERLHRLSYGTSFGINDPDWSS